MSYPPVIFGFLCIPYRQWYRYSKIKADNLEHRRNIQSHFPSQAFAVSPDFGNAKPHDTSPDTWLCAVFVAYNETDGHIFYHNLLGVSDAKNTMKNQFQYLSIRSHGIIQLGALKKTQRKVWETDTEEKMRCFYHRTRTEKLVCWVKRRASVLKQF